MRRLPPFAAIRAFDAAARHLSFKEAAAELGLTPTAVSHQIRQLEEDCGRLLFHRKMRQVELTSQGSALAEAIEPALDAIAAAYARLMASQGRSNVSLGAGPIFASRWLVPRLGAFWADHPGIDLWIHHSPLPVWRQIGQSDLAVAWGGGNWPGLDSAQLLRIEVSPVISPALRVDRRALDRPQDVLTLPLLHYRSDKGWRQWLSSVGVAAQSPLPGAVFEDANVLLQATLAGRGVSLGILDFINDELSAGRLVRLFQQSIDPGEAYYLVWRKNAALAGAVLKVRDWLLTQANIRRAGYIP